MQEHVLSSERSEQARSTSRHVGVAPQLGSGELSARRAQGQYAAAGRGRGRQKEEGGWEEGWGGISDHSASWGSQARSTSRRVGAGVQLGCGELANNGGRGGVQGPNAAADHSVFRSHCFLLQVRHLRLVGNQSKIGK